MGKNDGNIFNVTSNNQQGGITAGQVVIGRPQKPPRRLDEQLRSDCRTMLPRDKRVIVGAVSDTEAWEFATEIWTFLKEEGFTVMPSVFSLLLTGPPFNGIGLLLDPDATKINVGYNG